VYLLAFKNEPLIKIGITEDISSRVEALNGYFDLGESYSVSATDRRHARLLERNLHTLFLKERASAGDPLTSGNTEIFRAEVLPRALEFIERFGELIPNAGYRALKGVTASDNLYNPRKPRKLSKCRQKSEDMVLRWKQGFYDHLRKSRHE
jgi:T5orf172 domain